MGWASDSEMHLPTLQTRSLWSTAPPEPRTRLENWPTLLYSWWATVFAAVVILTRLAGRKIRSNRLFREDWIMFLALIPLFVRMAFIHVVLVYGTNNVATEGVQYTELQLEHRRLGARLVLAARIWYAIFIWMSKWAVSEFLKRITIQIWRPSYEKVLHGIRIFLVATLIAVIIATLAECQPFDHYWQVIPDPGPHCRQGFAQLITMGTADIITDILLVVFPIPIVLRSGQTWRRKVQVSALFSTSIALILITGFRVPEVIEKHGRQQYRTVWASSEILASAFVSNFVIIGSFLRDKGTKRNRYKSTSVSDSIDRASVRRQNTLQIHNYGSDDDLFRDLGCRVPEHLRDEPSNSVRMAPMALPAMSSPYADREAPEGARRPSAMKANSDDESTKRQAAGDGQPLPSPTPSQVTTKKNVSFFDVGGLLEDSPPSPSTTRSRSTTILSSGNSHTVAYDFAPATPSQSRRGSRAFMSDIGGMLIPSSSRTDSRAGGESSIVGGNGYPRRGSLPGGRLRNGAPIGVLGPMLERQETQVSLQDAGGLLSDPSTAASPLPASSPLALSTTTPETRPRPGPSRAPPSGVQSPRLDRAASEQSLADVGGLLGTGTQRQWMTRSGVSAAVAEAGKAKQGKAKSYEDMDLHDPGGLLR